MKSPQELIFNEKRDVLVTLLDKAEDLAKELSTSSNNFSRLSKELVNSISLTRKNCYENLFDILLVAPFQVGKSTTIDCFTGGREVSPRGLGGGGIKTSACIIKVQNSEDEEEAAVVKWWDYESLCLRVDSVLGPIIRSQDYELERLYISKNSEKDLEKRTVLEQKYFSEIDFRSPVVKAKLYRVLSDEIQRYRSNKVEYGSEKIDELRFVVIVLAFFDNPRISQLQKTELFGLDDIQELIRFPSDFSEKWNKYWEKSDIDLFSVEDVAYAFISEVVFKIKAEDLRVSGMSITDAPGLFVNTYDTKITLSEMQRASAIWYLTDGSTQLTEEDIRVLSEIVKLNHARKTFFGINFKRKKKIIQKSIEPAILADLSNLGFDPQVLYFNAFLALRALQGKKIMDETLDRKTRNKIIEDACEYDFNTDNEFEAWRMSTTQVLMEVSNANAYSEVNDNGLTTKSIDLVLEESQWLDAINKIKDYVFQERSHSILIDKGCDPIMRSLDESEKYLRLAEERAQTDVENAKQEWANARNQLKQFTQFSEEIIEQSIGDSWDILLAINFWERVMTKVATVPSRNAAKKIVTEATLSGILGNLIIDRPMNLAKTIFNYGSKVLGDLTGNDIPTIKKTPLLAERCKNIFLEEFENEFQLLTAGWFNSLKHNQDYQKNIFKDVRFVSSSLKDRWDVLNLGENVYLENLDKKLPSFNGDFEADAEKFFTEDVSEEVSSIVREQAAGKLLDLLTAITAGGGVLGGILMVFDVVFPGIGIILSVVVAVVIAVLASMQRNKTSYESKLEANLLENVNKELNIQESQIKDELAEKLSIIRVFYSEAFQISLNAMIDELEAIIAESEKNFRLNQKEREAVATLAKRLRLNHLSPLQDELHSFQDSVVKIWG